MDTYTLPMWVGLFALAIACAVFIASRTKPAPAAPSAPGVSEPTADPMIAVLRSHAFEFEHGDHDDEKESAVAIILSSGHRYGLASVFDIGIERGIVRVHDLQRAGRRVFIRIRDISAIEGSNDE